MPEVTLVGTGGMMPLTDRWLSCCCIEHNGKAILIDCGEGTQIALAAAKRKLSRVDMLLITHVHADHISGLPGFLLSLGNSSREEPLDIFMPEGTAHVVRKLCCICDRLPFEVRVHELAVSEGGCIPAESIDPMLKIRYMPLRHSTVCLGYSFAFARKPVFLPEKATALGIPVTMWKTLHGGENVTLSDGRLVTPDMVTGDKRHTVKICYVTDTLPFAGIAEFAHGADLFICEGMYGEEEKKESMTKKGHMLMQDACRLARKAEVQRLWLTHYSPAEKHPRRYEKTLRKIFPQLTISQDGERIELK